MGIFGWSLPPGCGTLPGEEDYDEFELLPSDKARITKLRKRISVAFDAWIAAPVPTFDSVWSGVDACLPESGRYEAEEAGDWQVYYCDDCQTWHKVAYSLDFDRNGEIMEGKRGPCIEVRSCDSDGDWDFQSASFAGDPDWPAFYREYVSSFDYFRSWADYHLWSAENSCADPVQTWYDLSKVDVKKNIDAALDNVRAMERMVKNAKGEAA